jgi:hypothetical protein
VDLPPELSTLPGVPHQASRPLDCLLLSAARPPVWWVGRLLATLLSASLPLSEALLLSRDLPQHEARPLDSLLLGLLLCQELTSIPPSSLLAQLRWFITKSTSHTDCQSQNLKRS